MLNTVNIAWLLVNDMQSINQSIINHYTVTSMTRL